MVKPCNLEEKSCLLYLIMVYFLIHSLFQKTGKPQLPVESHFLRTFHSCFHFISSLFFSIADEGVTFSAFIISLLDFLSLLSFSTFSHPKIILLVIYSSSINAFLSLSPSPVTILYPQAHTTLEISQKP